MRSGVNDTEGTGKGTKDGRAMRRRRAITKGGARSNKSGNASDHTGTTPTRGMSREQEKEELTSGAGIAADKIKSKGTHRV